MRTRIVERMRLFVNPRNPARGWLRCGALHVPAALGEKGVTHFPREGDKATPCGCFRLRTVFYRPDRVARPVSALPVKAIRPDDGWCDDPEHPQYNRPVRLPFPASAERMWREDHLYDIVVVLDFNIRPRVMGRGSAIFLHVARPDLGPTLGCVAIPEKAMRLVLAHCGPQTRLCVER